METKGLEMNTSVNGDVERQTDREREREEQKYQSQQGAGVAAWGTDSLQTHR